MEQEQIGDIDEKINMNERMEQVIDVLHDINLVVETMKSRFEEYLEDDKGKQALDKLFTKGLEPVMEKAEILRDWSYESYKTLDKESGLDKIRSTIICENCGGIKKK